MDEPTVGDALDAEREATMARIGAMTAEFEAIVASASGSNADDEHDPEGSTLAYERARVAALLADAHAYLDELDRASTRLAGGAYLHCERCGAPIDPERLVARPATRTCVRCASSRPAV
jgi:RNA polymerase-binding transcription factor DksA